MFAITNTIASSCNEIKLCHEQDCANEVYNDDYEGYCSSKCREETKERFNTKFPYYSLIVPSKGRDLPMNTRCDTEDCDAIYCNNYYEGYGYLCTKCLDKKAKQAITPSTSLRPKKLCVWCMELPIAKGFRKFCGSECAKNSRNAYQADLMKDKRARIADEEKTNKKTKSVNRK
jgi:hypothetical protein